MLGSPRLVTSHISKVVRIVTADHKTELAHMHLLAQQGDEQFSMNAGNRPVVEAFQTYKLRRFVVRLSSTDACP